MRKRFVTWDEIDEIIKKGFLDVFNSAYEASKKGNPIRRIPSIYAIPRGGLYVLNRIREIYPKLDYRVIDSPEYADLVVDDLIDSGKTLDEILRVNRSFTPFVLFDKRQDNEKTYYVFPWEDVDKDAQDLVTRRIEMIGENPLREGLVKTPERVVRADNELFAGYEVDTKGMIDKAVFSDGGDQMICLNNIEIYSTCEHHILPFTGVAHVGYIPRDGKVVGVSKIARVIDAFARRLQIQERITEQTAKALFDNEKLNPQGVGVIIEAFHLCMRARGVGKQRSVMTTSAMLGCFRDNIEVREEFMSLIKLTKAGV